MSAAADPRIAMLAQMREPACRLGMAFAAEAERAQGTDRWLDYFHAFDRCFFSVRVGIALELRLERAPAASAARPELRTDREDLRDREALDERALPAGPPRYHPEYDRERDRETERASLPILLRTLEGVVADAANLPGPEPAELPTLRELLVRMKAEPPTDRPSPGRLGGSRPMTPAAPQRRPASNVGAVLAARRATGPPRR